MAQRFFQSFRRLPGHISGMRKKQDSIEVVGNNYKIHMCSNIGFPSKASSLAYDQALNIFALVTRDGIIYVYGKPGVVYFGSHHNSADIIKVIFLTGTGRLLTLSDTDDVYIWELDSSDVEQPCLKQLYLLSSICSSLSPKTVATENETRLESISHVTALSVASNNTLIFFGTDNGCVATIRHSSNTRRKQMTNAVNQWILPTYEESINPQRVLQSIPPAKRARLRFDAIVVLLERPGFPGHLLIGYCSGVSIVYDFHSDQVLALLPWQYGLESAAWCGGSGLPLRIAVKNPTVMPSFLGTRLLTAHADGSLGVWRIPTYTSDAGVPNTSEVEVLRMEEAPSMPYGPFPCKLIGKVFWLPSHRGGITIFSGGMPRSTYGDKHTVSLLRGSNLDHAVAVNLAAANRRANVDGIGADDQGDDDDDEADEFDDMDQQFLANGLVPGAPSHVFDTDAPEHVCLDLPSGLVDICPLGPAGGPAVGLLILCEEEFIAIDLSSPGWPVFKLPYLSCLHSSSLSTYGVFSQVNLAFLKNLDRVSDCGKGDANGLGKKDSGYSKKTWPIQGGQCIYPCPNIDQNNSSNSDAKVDSCNVFASTDLLITGHENGTVGFWRLGPGGCARNVFTLFTGSLFEGEFGPDANGDIHNEADEESDPWPPFRKVGLFDPFMDDFRAAVKFVRLIDKTVVVGGAAGQIIVWQFIDSKPVFETVEVPIAPEVPGFRWKGHNPLTPKTQLSQRLKEFSLYPIGVALSQPPAQITCLAVCEQPTGNCVNSDKQAISSSSVLVGFGTPHGFGLVHFLPQLSPDGTDAIDFSPLVISYKSKVLMCHSTIPLNSEALEEAAVGEGWARRRTREIKNSLRDSFRRLKRMRSVNSIRRPQTNLASSQNNTPRANFSVSPKANFSARVGLRRSVTQSNPAAGSHMHGDPLQEAIQRSNHPGTDNTLPLSSGGEREICDRPTETASTAIVRCVSFGPPVHRMRAPPGTPFPVGSFYAGTSGGLATIYAIFSDTVDSPSTMAVRHASELILHHRAPIINIRLIDTKTYAPLSPNSFNHSVLSTKTTSPPPPHLVVLSEEQVRLFSLPAIHLRQKVRITAKDGFRIKAGSVIAFQQVMPQLENNVGRTDAAPINEIDSLHGLVRGNFAPEFGFIFTNNAGHAVILSIPFLRRRDTIPLMMATDVLAVNSVVFCENASCKSMIPAPSMGVYQLAPGQLTLFDVVLTGQSTSVLGSAYKALYRVNPAI